MALKVDLNQVRTQLEHDRILLDTAIQREKLRMVRSLVAHAKMSHEYLAPEFLRFYNHLENLVTHQPYESEIIEECLDEILDYFVQKNPTLH